MNFRYKLILKCLDITLRFKEFLITFLIEQQFSSLTLNSKSLSDKSFMNFHNQSWDLYFVCGIFEGFIHFFIVFKL